MGENLCFGTRFEGAEINESADPIEAMAEHYLGKSVCPRMYGKYKERLALLKDRIDRANADGVIMQNVRFCDLHGAENSLFEKAIIDGVVLFPSLFGIMVGSLPSITATHELVVPKSIPIIFFIFIGFKKFV